MDFDLSEDQRLLKEAVDRVLSERYGFEQRRAYASEAEGWSRAMWRQYAELGLLGLPFEERYGGFGGGPVEMMIVMEAFGRSLLLEPYLATVVLCGACLRFAGQASHHLSMIPRIVDGSLLLAFAHSEEQSRYDLVDVAVAARPEGAGWVIDGEKIAVLHGDCADKLIVSARVAGERRDPEGIGLFLIDSNAKGVTRVGYPTQDGLRAANIRLSGVRAGARDVIGELGSGLPIIERAVEGAIAALCAEAVGAMAAMHEITVDYLKTRKQFGVAIGNFQALQHRAVDMLVALEQARSMSIYASMMVEDTDPGERRKAIAAAKAQIGRSARFVGQQAIQLHGGIGLTMECKVGHYFKRVTMMEALLGDTEHHVAALARAGGLIDCNALQ
jgi:pimeloyl-CoA dehydrogenase small subunit